MERFDPTVSQDSSSGDFRLEEGFDSLNIKEDDSFKKHLSDGKDLQLRYRDCVPVLQNTKVQSVLFEKGEEYCNNRALTLPLQRQKYFLFPYPIEFRRKINLTNIIGITLSKHIDSNEFVIHVLNEEDLRLKSGK